jgi:hypothetical protein
MLQFEGEFTEAEDISDNTKTEDVCWEGVS